MRAGRGCVPETQWGGTTADRDGDLDTDSEPQRGSGGDAGSTVGTL